MTREKVDMWLIFLLLLGRSLPFDEISVEILKKGKNPHLHSAAVYKMYQLPH